MKIHYKELKIRKATADRYNQWACKQGFGTPMVHGTTEEGFYIEALDKETLDKYTKAYKKWRRSPVD
jgi:hypothetical protein